MSFCRGVMEFFPLLVSYTISFYIYIVCIHSGSWYQFLDYYQRDRWIRGRKGELYTFFSILTTPPPPLLLLACLRADVEGRVLPVE